MSSKTVIITGGNSGLGLETAKRIAQNPAFSLILACRDAEKAQRARAEIAAAAGRESAAVMQLDLASLESVRSFAGGIAQRGARLYGLINNAGVSGMHTGLTADGLDCVFQTNHLGHFLLTNLLLPAMREDARILSISSDMHCPPQGELVWQGADALAHPGAALAQSPARYSYSKMCNLYFVRELAGRLAERGAEISVNAFNPGLMIETGFMPGNTRQTREQVQRTMPHRVGDLEGSAAALALLMTEPEYGRTSGNYYDRSTRTAKSSPLSYDRANAAQLWKDSARLCGIAETLCL